MSPIRAGTLSPKDSNLFEDEHKAFRESFETFLIRRVIPEYAQWREDGRVPRELLQTAAQDGFLGNRVPEAQGGAGVDDPRFGLIAAEQAMLAGAPALALALALGNEVVVPALTRDGSDAQQAAWLPSLASAQVLATVVLGDDLTIACADGGAKIDGRVTFVAAGIDADLLLVLARDAAEPGRSRAALVGCEAAGLEIVPSEPGIGLSAAGLADISFVQVAAEPVADIGAAQRVQVDLALVLAVTAIGGARAALGLVTEYVLERQAFGQPIARFENTRQVLGEAAANLEAGRAFVETGIRASLAGELTPSRAAALKLYCSELYGAVVDTAVQLHGGYGYIMEYPIAHAYADARFWRLYGGTTRAMSDLVAGAILG